MVSSSVLTADLDLDSAVPAVVAAYRFQCSVATVKGWARRGYVDPEDGQRKPVEVLDEDPRWGRLYRWRDLLAAELASRAQTQRSHRGAVRRKAA